MCDMARWSPIDSRCYSAWWKKCTSMYKTLLQKCNILMCFTHWINLLFTLKVATTVLGSLKFLSLWNSVSVECYTLLNGNSENRHKSSNLKVYKFLSYDRFFWIICETHEEIAVTVIQVISIAILYWHCKNIRNLRSIFGVNMIYEYMI